MRMPTADGELIPSPGPDICTNRVASNGSQRPQLRKSRTIFADPSTSHSSSSSPPRRAASSPSLAPPASRHATFSHLPSRQCTVDDPSGTPIREVDGGSRVLDHECDYNSYIGASSSKTRSMVRIAKGSSEMKHNLLPAAEDSALELSQCSPVRDSEDSSVSVEKLVGLEQQAMGTVVEEELKMAAGAFHPVASAGGPHRTVTFLLLLLLSAASVVLLLLPLSFRNKISELEEQLLSLRQSCTGIVVSSSLEKGISQDGHSSFFSYVHNFNSRSVISYTVTVSFVASFLFRYLDHIPRLRTHELFSRNNEEEVPLKKRLAYRVDVFFSVYSYAKLLALLFATIILIGFGGLSLYSVSEGTLSEALWLSWTFVADSGNHADRVGTGPRIVSVLISSGGMLIFATMLGLVSDAISEKVDSLRKGKSEVMESNHILILGWSDKLVICQGNFKLNSQILVVLVCLRGFFMVTFAA